MAGEPMKIDWVCPDCLGQFESEVESVTAQGHKCLDAPLFCSRCVRFTAKFNFETNRVEHQD
jgi:hypothetical protein